MSRATSPRAGQPLLAVSLAVLLATAVVATGCGGRSTPPGPAPATTPVSTAAVPTTTAAQGSTTPPSSPATDLTGFLSAARLADQRIRHAAQLVSNGVGRTEIRFDRVTLDAVQASRPQTVAGTIPPGLDAPLLRAVLLVYSDLLARSAAFNRVLEVGTEPHPVGDPMAQQVMACLAGGAAVAGHFAADLDSLQAVARATAPGPVVSPRSRAAAELAVRLTDLDLRNNGCGACGGERFPELQPIRWTATNDSGYTGTVAGIRFTAAYRPGSGWQVELAAC